MDPVAALQEYSVLRKKEVQTAEDSGFLLVMKNGTPMRYEFINNKVRLAGEAAGWPRSECMLYSWRIGMVSAASAAGESDRTIERLGRWAPESKTKERYVRMSFRQTAAASVRIADFLRTKASKP
jgi:hypothetical protein